MNDVLNSLFIYLRDNWPELLWILLATGAAAYFASWRARARWRKGNFLDRLNVSLTSIDNGVLRIRTILEMESERFFLNTSAAKAVIRYAERTTETNPVLPIPEQDCWQFLNAVLNEISERFSAGQLKRDMGLDVKCEVYLLALTRERAGPIRTQKVRCMMIRKSLLQNLPGQEPQYENPWHATRWVTLQQLAEAYETRPYQFLEMKVCF